MKTLALLLCLLLLPVVPGFSGGAREADLSEVQRLIDTLDYPAALRLLAKIQREHPEQRDETQRLIVHIINTQGEKYNEVLGSVLHVLYDQGDEVKAAPMIDELRRLDPSRSVSDAQKLTGYLKFLKLMTSAAALLGQKKYTDALSLYLLPITDPEKAGFDMDKPTFDSSPYSDLIKASVRDAVVKIVGTASDAARDEPALRPAAAASVAVLASTPGEGSVSRLADALSPLSKEMFREKTVRQTAAGLETLNRTLADKAKAGRGDPYVQYIIWLSAGRKSRGPEGIAEAVRRMWQGQAASVADKAVESASSSLPDARKLFDSGNYAAADPALEKVYYRGLLAVKASVLAGSSVQPLPDWSLAASDNDLLKGVLPRVSTAQEVAGEAAALRMMMAWQREFQGFPRLEDVSPSALPDLRARMRKLADDAQRQGAQWQSRLDGLTAQVAWGLPVQPLVDSAADTARRLGVLGGQLQERDTAYALALAASEAGNLQADYRQAVDRLQQGQDKLNGTVNGKTPAEGIFVERNAGAALDLFDAARAGLDSITAGTSGFRQEWQHERSSISASREMTALLGGLSDLDRRVADTRVELDRVSRLSQEQHRNALAKRREGDQAFSDASKAIAARSYDTAKVQLDAARGLYLDSLLLEENKDVRRRYTTDIPSLLDKINQSIFESYVAEADAQIAAGRKLFSNGEFLKASITLEQAQARWRSTVGDRPNTDLDNLMERVRNALRLSGGRDLSPEDSRAPAVNGFLNLANAKVAQADKLQKTDSGRKRLLDDAYNNVLSALDLAPVYRTAKALQLRIRKLEAPNDSTFRAEAGGEIAEILTEYRSGRGQRDRLYFSLKDYQDLFPDYPGLKDAVQSLEVELGFRVREPSAAEVARSNNSYAEAVSLYDPANVLTFDPSLKLLDDSISLNPANNRAIALRRAILLKQGNPEVSAISQGDLARFAEAKRLYNTEDYAGAYTICKDLLAGNKKNASYPPLVQLYGLIQQKLGL
ncbi:MAG TPA: hypothetical protein VMV03_07570 [Spirochaetia bacterium]|nr:hypothetical protein [Spirochaetia bacterium]